MTDIINDLLTLADSMDADSYPGSDLVRAAAELFRWSMSLDWVITPYEYGIELHCPDCHTVIYHQEHASVSLGDIKALIAEHECEP